jgi:hypothetical protein
MHKYLKLRFVFAAIAALTVIFAVVLFCYQWKLQKEARSLLSDLTALKPGKSSGADAEGVTSRQRRFLTNKDCKEDSCEYWFEIRNGLLAALHLEPPAGFLGSFTVKNDTVVQIGAGLARSMPIYPSFGGSAGMADEYAELPKWYARYARGGHYLFPTPVGKPYLKVTLDSHANSQQREHAFAFSFRCLTKIGGGCDAPCDYLPLAWNDWKDDLQKGGFPMDQFEQVYRRQNHCK